MYTSMEDISFSVAATLLLMINIRNSVNIITNIKQYNNKI